MLNETPAGTDVIVVGGGLAVLAAAAYLARAGSSVTLFEQAAVVGGRARTRKQGAFSLNQGRMPSTWVGPEGQLSGASLASARLASHLILTTEASQWEYGYAAASQV